MKEEGEIMRFFMIFVWCFVLFIGTCVHDIRHIFTDFYFLWNMNPQWDDLLKVNDSHTTSYFIQKMGHFCGFFILSLLMSNFGRMKNGVLLAIAFGILTELIQPLFSRDGRILDMVIDAVGAILAYMLSRKILHKGTL